MMTNGHVSAAVKKKLMTFPNAWSATNVRAPVKCFIMPSPLCNYMSESSFIWYFEPCSSLVRKLMENKKTAKSPNKQMKKIRNDIDRTINSDWQWWTTSMSWTIIQKLNLSVIKPLQEMPLEAGIEKKMNKKTTWDSNRHSSFTWFPKASPLIP